ncbi:insulinase family protein [candidate division WWE3 bacterium]|uniref:Insulinase family protein n=1 Tax=candidate division WWE3 bacterium TaxID=2053526 RepID=A0A7X9DK74_UNCKA|nr:insulinase family protein [candidate division WWE3 bacterium]
MYYDIQVFTLNNGLKIGFVDCQSAPYACVHLRGLAGSNYETSSIIGAAHLLEHVLVDNGDIRDLSQSSKIIAICSRDDVIYGFKTLQGNVINVIHVIKRLLNAKTISNGNLELHKNNVKNEIFRHTTNPEKYITRLIYKTLFPNSRLAILNTGDITHVDKLTCSDLESFYCSRYKPNRFVVTVSGHFSDKMKDQIIQQMSEIETNTRNTQPVRDYVKLEPLRGQFTQHIKVENMVGGLIKYDFYGKTVDNDQKYALTVLCKCLENRLAVSKIAQELYKLTCNNFSTGSYGFIDIFMAASNTNYSKYVQQVYELIQNYEPDFNELEKTKKEIVARFILSIEKISNLTDYYSELLLHGRENQTMKYEINQIQQIDREKIGIALDFIRLQTPKITVMSW